MQVQTESTEEKVKFVINSTLKIAFGYTGAVIGGPVGAALGSAAVEALDRVQESPVERRLRDWQEKLNTSIARNLNDKLSAENLANNPVFVSAIIHATHLALRSHEQEKLSALRNAVINVACDLGDTANYQIYLNLIGELTPTHLHALKFFQNPTAWFKQHNIVETQKEREDQTKLLQLAIPELKDLAPYLIDNLLFKGLLNSIDYKGVVESELNGTPKPTYMTKQTTKIADQFLQFIEDNQQLKR